MAPSLHVVLTIVIRMTLAKSLSVASDSELGGTSLMDSVSNCDPSPRR